MESVRARLEDLRIYSWETASLAASDLLALEAATGSFFSRVEGVPIVTCQRYEIVTASSRCPTPSQQCYEGEEALLHLSRLAAGLESLVLGESEILGQVRSAFSNASEELRTLVAPAIAAARALRAEQSFTQHAGHALDLALEYTESPAAGSLLVVGGGPMGRRVAERASALGFDTTLAARRPLPLPAGIRYRPFASLPRLEPVDVLVTCLGRAAPQMSAHDLPPVDRIAIDLGTPRNLTDEWDVPVVTLAALIGARRDLGSDSDLRRSLEARLRELLASRLSTGASESPLGSLREEIERIRQRELMRSLRLHPELPPEKLDTITRTLVNQIFHRPSRRLKQSGDLTLAATLADLFREREEFANGD